MDENSKIMDREIKKRMESNSWDLSMAERVIKKRSRKRVAYSVSIASLAAAALVLIFLLFGIKTDLDQNTYEQFISKQVNGTYMLVFNGNSGIDAAGNIGADSDDIDSIIDNTLSMR